MGLNQSRDKCSVFNTIRAQKRTAHDALIPPLGVVRIDIKRNVFPSETVTQFRGRHFFIGQPVIAQYVGIVGENVSDERSARIESAIRVYVTRLSNSDASARLCIVPPTSRML